MENTDSCNNTLNLVLDLGHKTVVRVNKVNFPSDDNNMALDYDIVSRGRLSFFQLKKKIKRFIENVICVAIAKENDKSNWKRKSKRAEHWNTKNIVFKEVSFEKNG